MSPDALTGRETDALVTKVENRTNTVAKQFDRICDLLLEFDYLAADPSAAGGVKLTNDGAMLMRLYSDKDLLTARTEGGRLVRFPGWQGTQAGEREVKKALRKALFKYKLHADEELFEKAYSYIRQYY